mmetsp:Transcript_53645/g.160138  ORF Transcript_53645/g.160138 Transcript_53645/m.160138 type:complete len:231 (-) Transcript_53645:1299-1991(-)
MLQPHLGPLAGGGLGAGLRTGCLARRLELARGLAPGPGQRCRLRARCVRLRRQARLREPRLGTLLLHRPRPVPKVAALLRPPPPLAAPGLPQLATCILLGALLQQPAGAAAVAERGAQLRELALHDRERLAVLLRPLKARGPLAPSALRQLGVLLLQGLRAQPPGLVGLLLALQGLLHGLRGPLRLDAALLQLEALALERLTSGDHAEDLPLRLLAPAGLASQARFQLCA